MEKIQNWKKYKLKDCVNINPDTIASSTDPNYRFKYIDISSVSKGNIDIPEDTIAFEMSPSRARRLFRKKDILFGTVRPYLQSHVYINFDVKDMVASTGFAVLRTNGNLDSNYLYHYIFSNNIKSQIDSLLVGSNYPAINVTDVGNLEIYIPPLKEQKKIAEILSTWDDSIKNLSNTIHEEKRKKKSIVSRIYRGHISKKIEGTIKYSRLKNNITEVTIRNKEDNELVLSVSNTKGFIPQSEQFDREVASENRSNYKIVKKNQFAYNPSRINVGSIDMLTSFESGILSPMYVVFETKASLHNRYLYHFLKSELFLQIIPRYTQGSVRDSLSFKGLSSMKIYLPELAEQSLYAEALDTIDNYIEKLEKLRDLYKVQKQGLMQQLLTGKIRVNLN